MKLKQFIDTYSNLNCLKSDFLLNFSELRKINIKKIDAMRKY